MFKILSGQEKELVRDHYDDNAIHQYLKDVAQYKLLTAQEEKELSKKIQNGDENALQILINSNLRLVIKIAKIFVSKSYPLIDLIQDGNIGLIRAAQKYDYRKNVKFSTYSATWIKQMIIRALSQKKRIIRLPYRKEMSVRKIKQIAQHLEKMGKRTPSLDEMAKYLNMTKRKIKEILGYDVHFCSLNLHPNHVSNGDRDGESYSVDHNCTPDRIFEKQYWKQKTEDLLNDLPPEEKMLIVERFGLGNVEKQTLKKISSKIGVSTESVRQIENRILKKLRKKCKYWNLELH